jgi:hypothetical protein
VREVVGLHKERYCFPIKIAVTRASGSGEDSLFMGVLKVGGRGVGDGAARACWQALQSIAWAGRAGRKSAALNWLH